MNKKSLWDKFIRTGKISDYLSYRRAERFADDDELTEYEIAQEIHPECPNGEDYRYDDQNDRYSDS